MTTLRLIAIVLASAVAGLMNAVAGGGTLLTFPALVGLGVTPIVANATSTVALWPGALGSLWGYRGELAGARGWALRYAVPSLAGGLVGAWLLLRTPAERFEALVPYLVLGATALFVVQGRLVSWLRLRREERSVSGSTVPITLSTDLPALPPVVIAAQFLVGVYGGYFGAGVGILVLAVLGLLGLTNIHRMNGLKNWAGLCMNAVAALVFAFSSLVDWPVALSMAVGATIGGYGGSRMAQRLSQAHVRKLIVAIGLGSGLWMLAR